MSKPVVRVVIADDNRAFRRAIRLRLERAENVTVIGEATNGADAVTIATTEKADVVLMDLQMPEVDGVAATRLLTAPDAPHRPAVVALTSHVGDRHVLGALDAGAVGYLLKTHDSAQLVDAIHAAARGEALVSSRVTRPRLRELARRRADDGGEALAALTPAERRVVGCLARGVTGNEQIARDLHVSINTVRTQVRKALARTGLADRTQLALWGARHGLADASPDV